MGFLKELQSARGEFVAGMRRNRGFEAGILHLLTELYPHDAHFLYELLQNAEDARATRVHFALGPEGLLVEHDGERLFTRDDVESITNIGASTKRDDVNQIGKFGVGFKAVFSYTRHPTVRSGEFAFRIRDLVVPEPLGPAGAADGITRFEFPFDHPSKEPAAAFAEIEAGLWGLPVATVLFLGSVAEISWRVEGGGSGYLRREAHTPEHVEIARRERGGEVKRTHWLRLAAPVEERPGLVVALAFRLSPAGDGRAADAGASLGARFALAADEGTVSIYFPAEKETSGLRFHVHAPFAATVARDSIKSQPANGVLVEQLAALAARSAHRLRELGLMNRGALDVFPNRNDRIGEFYGPIRDALWEEFRGEALAPTDRGGHLPGTSLRGGSAESRALLDAEALTLLSGHSDELGLGWAPAVDRDSRAASFLRSIGMTDFPPHMILMGMVRLGGEGELEGWLESKSDAWMQQLYALLSAETHRLSIFSPSALPPLVRLSDGRHVRPSDAYFAPDGEQAGAGEAFVAPGTYGSGDAAKAGERERARSFLRAAGVRELDEGERIKRSIAEWQTERRQERTRAEHLGELVGYLRYWRRTGDIKPFAGLELLGDRGEGAYWCPASRIVLDEPYESRGLLAWFEEVERRRPRRAGDVAKTWYALSSHYWSAKGLSRKDIVAFAVALGVKAGLEITKASTDANPSVAELRTGSYGARRTSTEIDLDWTIPHLELMLASPSESVARLVWETMRAAPADYLKASYRPNQSYGLRQTKSQLVHALAAHNWVPQRDGSYARPRDAVRELLPDGFEWDDGTGWLTAIGFTTGEKKRESERKAHLAAVKQLVGADADEEDVDFLERISRLSKEQRRALGERLEEMEHGASEWEFDDDVAPNPDRRARKAAESAGAAPERGYVKKLRSVSDGDRRVRDDARPYLRDRYTRREAGADGPVVCQVCRHDMPFRLDDGSSYFEAVELLKDLKGWQRENFLALCPTDAAKYKYASRGKAEFLDLLARTLRERTAAELNAGTGHSFPIVLAGARREVHFSPKHLVDLKGVLSGDAAVATGG